MVKRILAIIGIVFIVAWVIATFILALLQFPGKSVIFTFMMIGCIFFPIMLWLLLWMISFVTGKKNIASMNAPNEVDPLELAAAQNNNNENSSDTEKLNTPDK